MSSRILRKINAKQALVGVIALATVICIPKIGDTVSNALGKVRTKLSGASL